MADTFTWIPDFGAEKQHNHAIRVSTFGEGYEQRQEDGMNPVSEVWPLQFTNRKTVEAGEIDTFLNAHRTAAFLWTPPGAGAPMMFKCTPEDWSKKTVTVGFFNFTAKFTQVFEP